MSLPVTPNRESFDGPVIREHDSPSQLHSILRKVSHKNRGSHGDSVSPRENAAPTKLKYASPQSQVRFSIPNSSLTNDVENSLNSPPKIVFPKSPDNEEEVQGKYDEIDKNSLSLMSSRGHFVDMHSGVMLDVPEEIWNFHTGRRVTNKNSQHHRTHSLHDSKIPSGESLNWQPTHSRSKSLQAIILDTMNLVEKDLHSSAHYNLEQNSFSSVNTNNSNVSQVSPLRLQRQIRPELYLTPESPMNSYRIPIPLEISLPPYLSPQNKKKKRNSLIFDGEGYSKIHQGETSDSEELSSDNSIPSANHDLSFNINLDNEMNIDKALGIDKDANVNLKVQNKNLRKQHFSATSSAAPQIEDSESLKILSTPSKLIHIPDLEYDTLPKSPHGTLKFFDEFEPADQQLPSPYSSIFGQKESIKQDQLDMSFTFPAPAQDPNFLKVDTSPTNDDFLQRRNRLIEQNMSPANNKGHRHRRSRSVHNADDLLVATSTPPQIPKRSPLRPKSPTIDDTESRINKQSPMQIDKNLGKLEIESGEEISLLDEASSVYGELEVQNPWPIESKANVIDEQPCKHFIAEDDDNFHSGEDKSIEFLSERIIDEAKTLSEVQKRDEISLIPPARPVTLMNSFHGSIIPPTDEDFFSVLNSNESLKVNLLSPKRSLSNVGSQSSYNSEFSKKTNQSSTTSYPSQHDPLLPYNVKKNGDLYFHEQAHSCNSKLPNKNIDPIRSIYEKRDGKLVEVLVLDDFYEDDKEKLIQATNLKSSRRPISHEEASQNYAKILQMCEQTAIQAKGIILQLVEEKSHNKFHENMLLRPVPPNPKDAPQQVFPKGYSKGQTAGKGQERYLKNLNRSLKSRSSQKPIINGGI